MNDKALVTLLIGDSIRTLWVDYMEKGWRQYAAKHGYDIVIIDEFIDKSPLATERTPHWQKCLVAQHPSVASYAQAVWIDADITINHFTAPSIAASIRTNKVGCVVTDGQGRARETYAKYGVTGKNTDHVTNTGVLAMRPAIHGEMMNWVYHHYKENAHSAKENIPLSFHLFANDLVEPIDPRFNVDWTGVILSDYPFLANLLNPDRELMVPYCIHAAWAKAFFLHFINQHIDLGIPGKRYTTREDIRFLIQDELNPIGLKPPPPASRS